MALSEDAAAKAPRHVTTTTRPIGFWLRLVDRLIDEQFDHVLRDYNVTRAQWEILNILSPGPGSLDRLNHELAPFFEGDDAGGTTEQVAGLIERGWVDVAFEYYELTGVGAVKHAELHRIVAKTRAAAVAEVDDDDYATTLRSLEKIARTLGWQS